MNWKAYDNGDASFEIRGIPPRLNRLKPGGLNDELMLSLLDISSSLTVVAKDRGAPAQHPLEEVSYNVAQTHEIVNQIPEIVAPTPEIVNQAPLNALQQLNIYSPVREGRAFANSPDEKAALREVIAERRNFKPTEFVREVRARALVPNWTDAQVKNFFNNTRSRLRRQVADENFFDLR